MPENIVEVKKEVDKSYYETGQSVVMDLIILIDDLSRVRGELENFYYEEKKEVEGHLNEAIKLLCRRARYD